MHRFNSTIKIKTGHCIDCPPDASDKPLQASRCPIHYKAYRSKQVILSRQKRQGASDLIEIPNNNYLRNVLGEWFKERRKEMTGRCADCGSKSCKDNDAYYRYSIAHIFPKSYFPSVATHPLNWIELCFWYESCHTNMDNIGLSYAVKMKCWPEMVRRFRQFEHLLTDKEKGRKYYQQFKEQADKTIFNNQIKEK
jgi:hypothetical protein